MMPEQVVRQLRQALQPVLLGGTLLAEQLADQQGSGNSCGCTR